MVIMCNTADCNFILNYNDVGFISFQSSAAATMERGVSGAEEK